MPDQPRAGATLLETVVREAQEAWRIGYDPADSGPTMAEAVAQAIRNLPVHERMAAMGMEPTYETYGNEPTWVERGTVCD